VFINDDDFFLEAISTCVCGGMVKNDPDALSSIDTTANPLRTLERILLYAVNKRSSINA
jgi:hypothetical protein